MKPQGKSRIGLAFIALIVFALVALGAGILAHTGSEGSAFSPPRLSVAHARSLLDEGKTAEARKLFEEAIKKDKKDVEAVRGLAECAIQDGDDEAAIGLLYQLTTLAPKDRAAWRKLALCASRLGRDMEAMSASQTALSLAPEGDRGMSDLVARLVTKKSTLEGGMAGDQLPGDALPGRGRKGAGIDPASGVRLPEAPDPRRNLPAPGRDR